MSFKLQQPFNAPLRRPQDHCPSKLEFTLPEAVDFIAILSGRPSGEPEYREKIADALNVGLKPDICTSMYKRELLQDEIVMMRIEGEYFYSRAILVPWINRQRELINPLLGSALTIPFPSSPAAPPPSMVTKKQLERFSRKPSLHIKEVVQLVHLLPNLNFKDEAKDTLDTIWRQVLHRYKGTMSYESLFDTSEILTQTAELGYQIPAALAHRVMFPIEGVNWPPEKVPEKKRLVREPVCSSLDIGRAPNLLRIAIEAWRRVWINGEVAAVQKAIIPWLVENYKIKQNEAKAIDQIIRPTEKKKGAVKKRTNS